jgi:hypothetical protein
LWWIAQSKFSTVLFTYLLNCHIWAKADLHSLTAPSQACFPS